MAPTIYERGQNLTRKQTYLAEFYQRNYGFTLSGPIIPNKLFFFVNPEWQKFHTPTSGPDETSPSVRRCKELIDLTQLHRAVDLRTS